MAKSRVGVVLREQMGSKSNNRSTDLDRLTKNYHLWCKKMSALVESIKKHLHSLQQVTATRAQVAKCFGMFSKETPLFDCTGLLPSEDRPANTVCSYASIHDELGAKTKSYCGKYQQFVLDYAVEWEKVVRTRIDGGLKKAEELLRDLDHYQKKVESLRLTTNQAMAKGKSVASGTQEKLSRNEEKLISAKQNYNRVATDLVILMEEVTERSWRDLHPLLIKCAQFDMTLSADEAEAFSVLRKVVDALKVISNDKGISPQHRLKDLASLKPELVSTRPGGVSGLQIEYAGSNESGTNSAPMMSGGLLGDTALAPGSVGPQGLGGFPVQLSSSTNGTSGSGQFANDPLSNGFNMLALSANPTAAPTMDDIYNSQQYNPSSSITSGPNSGGFGPPPTTSNWNQNYRSVSFNDADSAYSGYSGYSAPPLAAPPLAPPTSMPPPVPPPLPPSSSNSFGYNSSIVPLSSSIPRSYSMDPYSPANASQTSSTSYGGGNTSPWSSNAAPTSSGSMYSPPPIMQQPPSPSFNNMGGQKPPPPQPNQGYNPFG